MHLWKSGNTPISQSLPCSSRSLRPHACVIGWKCLELHVWSLKSPPEMSGWRGKPTHELWWAEFATEINYQHELSHCLEDSSCHHFCLVRTAEVHVFSILAMVLWHTNVSKLIGMTWATVNARNYPKLLSGNGKDHQSKCTYWWLKSCTTWTWNVKDAEKRKKKILSYQLISRISAIHNLTQKLRICSWPFLPPTKTKGIV